MFDIVIKKLKEEVALDGQKGKAVSDLWDFVQHVLQQTVAEKEQQAAAAISMPIVDDDYKNTFWPFLRRDPDFLFFEHEEQSVPTDIEHAAEHEPSPMEDVTEENNVQKSTAKTKDKGKGKANVKSKTRKAEKNRKRKAIESDDDCESKENDSEPDEAEPDDLKDNQESEIKKQRKAMANGSNGVPIPDICQMEYAEVQRRFGNRLRVVASEKLQMMQMKIGIPPGCTISINCRVIMQVILQSRAKGITQAELTKVLDLDPRSTGHYVKSLEQKGVIVRKSYPVNGIFTNLCVHVRFSRTDQTADGDQQKLDNPKKDKEYRPHNMNADGIIFSTKALQEKIGELLLDATDHVMFSEDILGALGFNYKHYFTRKWFNRVVDNATASGLVQKFSAQMNNAGPRHRCLRLVDPEAVRRNLSTKESLRSKAYDSARIHSRPHNPPIILGVKLPERTIVQKLTRDESAEHQILKVVTEAGTNGLTQKTLQYILGYQDSRAVYKLLEKMISVDTPQTTKYSLRRVLESEGRNRRYRYYTLSAFSEVHENTNIQTTGSQPFKIDESKLVEEDWSSSKTNSKSSTITKRPRKNARAEAAKSNPRAKRLTKSTPAETAQSERMQTTEPSPAVQPSPQTTDNPPVVPSITPQNVAPIFRLSKRSFAQTQTAEGPSNIDIPSANVSTAERDSENTDALAVNSSRPKRRRHQPPESSTSQLSADTRIQPSILNEQTHSHPPDSNLQQQQQSDGLQTQHIAQSQINQQQSHSTTVPLVQQLEGNDIASASANLSPGVLNPSEIQAVATPRIESNDTQVSPATQRESTSQTQALPSKQAPHGALAPKRRNLFDYFSVTPARIAPRPAASDTPDNVQEMTRMVTKRDGVTKESEIRSCSPHPNEGAATSTSEAPAVSKATTGESAVSREAASVAGASVPAVGETPPPNEGMAVTQEPTTTILQQPEALSPNDDTVAPAPQRLVNQATTTTPNDNVSDESQIAPRRQKQKLIDVYAEQRKKILLAVLEERPICERGHELLALYAKKKAELYPDVPDNKHKPHLKTLWSTAVQITEEGLAHILESEVKFFDGVKSSKKLLLRKDMDKDGPEVAKYLELMNERKAVHPRAYRATKYETLGNVERLDDRLNRLEEEYSMHLKENDVTKAKLVEDLIKGIRTNLDKANALDHLPRQTKEKDEMIVASELGYINSKMVRVKLLHQFIYGLSQRQDIESIDTADHIIPSHTIINEMKLGSYFQIIGFFCQSNEIQNYIQDSENLQKPVREAPDEVRTLLFSERNKFRRRLRPLLDFLCLLGLIEPVHPEGSEIFENTFLSDQPTNLALSYKFKMDPVMYDYRRRGMPAVRHYKFDSSTDVLIYWSELQYFCTQTAPDKDDLREPENPAEEQLFKSLYTVKNWSTTYMYNDYQRKVLSSYIDRVNYTTPVDNIRKCKEIAEQIKISVSMVRGFFRKAEAFFSRKADQKTLRYLERAPVSQRKQKKPTGITKGPSQSKYITLNTKHVFKKTLRGSTVYRLRKLNQRSTESSEAERNPALFLDNECELPSVDAEGISSITNLLVKRSERKKWTSEEDEILLYCYAILKHRESICNRRFVWRSVVDIFPGRNPQHCRRRLGRLRKEPHIAKTIEKLCLAWRVFHNEGIRSGDISDGDIDDVEAFDALQCLEYFLTRTKGTDLDKFAPSGDPSLPNTLNEFYQNFRVESLVTDDIRCTYFEDQFHSKGTLLARHNILCLNIYRLKGAQFGLTDCIPLDKIPESDSDARILQLLQVFFRMILLSPQETYDAFFAYGVLHQYPHSLLKRAVELSRQSGLLVKTRGMRDLFRRLPGMIYTIAERYMNRMAGKMPDNYNMQALAYEEFLTKHKSDHFNPVQVSSGMMGCMLDLLAETRPDVKLSLKIINSERLLEKLKTPYSRSRLIDASRSDFGITMSLTGARNGSPDIFSAEKTSPMCLSKNDFDTALSGLLHVQGSEADAKVIRAVVDCLWKAEEQGANISGIKDYVVSRDSSISDEAIRHAIKSLEAAIPPLLQEVGFQAPRYVLATYLGEWEIVPKLVSIPRARQEETVVRNVALASSRKEVIRPRMWIDVNGTVTPAVQKGCLEVIAEIVMKRPGITEALVAEHFKGVITRMEVRDCLKELVRRKALRVVVTAHKSSPNICVFSKPRVYSAIHTTQIEASSQTAYFTEPGYYSKLK